MKLTRFAPASIATAHRVLRVASRESHQAPSASTHLHMIKEG